jgi:hypothetical protein
MKRLVLAGLMLAALSALAPPAHAAAPKPCRYLQSPDRLLPFPNDAFTRSDRRSATGRRLAISRSCTPRNNRGRPMAMTDQNRLDGFSPGSQLILNPPGLDNDAAFRRSGLAPITDIGASLRRNAPIVILDARTRRRQAYWVELDANATSDANRMLLVHPAKNFTEGRRYVVIVRGLRTSSGRRIGPMPGLARARGRDTKVRAMLALARRAGVSTSNLHAVWDFTVGSEGSLQRRMLTIRNDAFRRLGDTNLRDLRVAGNAPSFQIISVEEFTRDQNPNLLRRVTGTYTVPCYLTSPGCGPGGRFNLGSRGLPRQRGGNTQAAPFICLIPRSAAGAPGRAAVYGHGLLDSAQGTSDRKHLQLMAQEHNFTFCATDWTGFSAPYLPEVVNVIGDLSKFPEIPDGLQQGFLNFQYLGRLMRHPQGFVANPAFQVAGHPAFDTSNLFYDGNSQGGIMGGGLTASAPDFQRAVLGVPGINFSVLLTRSSNWKQYGIPFNLAYPDEAARPLLFSLMQLLWDRGEGNGWAAHMTNDPPAGTPRHFVLMHVVRGDHQVAPVAADAEARTIGARTNRVPLAPGAKQDKVALYGIPRTSFPIAGSAIIYWEPGGGLARAPLQPLTNIFDHPGADPHYDPRYTVAARRQKAAFLSPNGSVIDVCGGSFCQAEEAPPDP